MGSDDLIPISALQHNSYCPRRAADGCGGWLKPVKPLASGRKDRSLNVKLTKWSTKSWSEHFWRRLNRWRIVCGSTGLRHRRTNTSKNMANSGRLILMDRWSSKKCKCEPLAPAKTGEVRGRRKELIPKKITWRLYRAAQPTDRRLARFAEDGLWTFQNKRVIMEQ